MAKTRSIAHKSGAIKPLTSRPLDLTYYIFFLLHLIISVLIDLLPLWPAPLRTYPITKQIFGVMKGVADDYTNKTNDPFALVMWGMVKKEREWEWMCAKVFIWMEIFIQVPSFILGMIGLQQNSPKIYPLLLAYSTAALVTTITYMIIAYTAPSITDPTLDATARFHAMSEKGRWTILNATMPFLIIPAVMWIDMMVRLGHLVNAGVKAQKGKVNESKKL